MASFSAGTTFTDGVANDVTAAKLGALVNNATPTSGLIQDRTAETVTATNDTLLIGDASDSNNLKRITVANFAQTLPTAKITTGTIETGTFGTTTSTAATITTGTITTGVIPALTAGTTTSTAATITTGTIPTLVATTLITSGTGTAAAPAIVPTGDTNTGIFFPAADTIAFSDGGTESMRIDSNGRVGIGSTSPARQLTLDHASAPEIGLYTSGTERVKLSTGGTAASQFCVDTGGAERLRIDSSGNVGIGNTSPSSYNSSGDNLVIGNAGDNGITIVSGTDGKGYLFFADGVSGTNAYAGQVDFDHSVNALKFGVLGVERLRIDSSGRVGIGMTPASLLDISKSDNTGSVTDFPALRVTNTNSTQENGTSTYNYARIDVKSGNGTVFGDFGTRYDSLYSGVYIGTESSHPVFFQTGGAERLRIDSSGFVSIGTATALSALHVHGNVTLSNTTTATSAGTGGLSKPATYAGYLTVSINGTSRKIPYYAT